MRQALPTRRTLNAISHGVNQGIRKRCDIAFDERDTPDLWGEDVAVEDSMPYPQREVICIVAWSLRVEQ
jgi:hypothetical protein